MFRSLMTSPSWSSSDRQGVPVVGVLVTDFFLKVNNRTWLLLTGALRMFRSLVTSPSWSSSDRQGVPVVGVLVTDGYATVDPAMVIPGKVNISRRRTFNVFQNQNKNGIEAYIYAYWKMIESFYWCSFS